MKYIQFLLFFFLLYGTVSANPIDIKALEKSLELKSTDSARITTLIKISAAYTNIDPNKSIRFAEEALLLSKKQHNKEEECRSMNLLGFSLFVIGNYSRGLKISLEGLKLAQKINNSKAQIGIYNNLGNIYRRQGDYKSAISNFLKAKAIADKDKSLPQSNILSTLGMCYLETGRTDLAIDLLNNAYVQDVKAKSEGLSLTYNRMGDLHYKLKNIPLALEYYQKGVTTALTNDKPRWLCFNYVSLADLYQKENQTDSSIVYAKKALFIGKNKFQHQAQKASVILSDNYAQLKQSDSCVKYLKLAMVIKDTIQSNKEESQIQNLIFEERLQKIENAQKEEQLKEERSHNLQYSVIAITLILFLIIFLLLSHSIFVNEGIIRFLGILSLLIVFEFINLLLHPYLGGLVHHSPILMLCLMVLIASLLIPFHHKLEHWITHKLVEKNSQIRLMSAKRTPQAVDNNSPI
ncbi:MAG: tetratricopeptide repeat protein [Flavobacterium sp.]